MGVSVPKPKNGSGPFTDSGGSGVTDPDQSQNSSSDLAKLREELKLRTLQTHKLQEVCASLKKTFIENGGDGDAFDSKKELSEAKYDVKKAEAKRAAERSRAEKLVRELELVKIHLAKLQGHHANDSGKVTTGVLAATEVNRGGPSFEAPRGGQKISSNREMLGGENAAPRKR